MSKLRFTLIELLVVVAIIGILASLLLPNLAKAREKARQSLCANNEKQLGISFALYHDDNEAYYPIGPNQDSPIAWTDLLGRYKDRKTPWTDHELK